MTTKTITVREFAENGAPEGFDAFLNTFNGAERVDHLRWWPEDPWAVCPEGNGGFGISYAVHSGMVLHLRPKGDER